jgi:rhodanese-related sulfurtransferase
MAMRSVTRNELAGLIESGTATIVEALPAPAYRAEHLPGAVNVPGELSADLAAQIAPDPSRTVIVDCSGPSCTKSKATAARFERLGYRDVRVYPGGKADWWQGGLPMHGERHEPATPPVTTVDQSARSSMEPPGRSKVAAVLAAVACAACCALPFLIAAGVLTGAGAALAQNVLLGAAGILITAAGLMWWLHQRRSGLR